MRNYGGSCRGLVEMDFDTDAVFLRARGQLTVPKTWHTVPEGVARGLAKTMMVRC